MATSLMISESTQRCIPERTLATSGLDSPPLPSPACPGREAHKIFQFLAQNPVVSHTRLNWSICC